MIAVDFSDSVDKSQVPYVINMIQHVISSDEFTETIQDTHPRKIRLTISQFSDKNKFIFDDVISNGSEVGDDIYNAFLDVSGATSHVDVLENFFSLRSDEYQRSLILITDVYGQPEYGFQEKLKELNDNESISAFKIDRGSSPTYGNFNTPSAIEYFVKKYSENNLGYKSYIATDKSEHVFYTIVINSIKLDLF
jgi:hypothetical protein